MKLFLLLVLLLFSTIYSQDLNNDGVVDNTDRTLFRQYLKSQNLDADFNGGSYTEDPIKVSNTNYNLKIEGAGRTVTLEDIQFTVREL